MASIVKRKNRYSVVYSYTDENGVKRQKWETFATNAEAKNAKCRLNLNRRQVLLLKPKDRLRFSPTLSVLSLLWF